MALQRSSGVPPTPTLPTGMQVASFDTYIEAQRAVDTLSDNQFPVQRTTIVGTDLRMVERITGRLSYPRVALAGAMSGAWFGLFVGLLFGLMSDNFLGPLLPALFIGAAFGMLFGLVSYAFTGGKRDFTSSSQVVASRYALLCEPEQAGEAQRLMHEAGIHSTTSAPAGRGVPYGATQPGVGEHGRGSAVVGAPGAAPAPEPGAGQQPAQSPDDGSAPQPSPFTPWQDAQGNPLYGQRVAPSAGSPDSEAPAPGAPPADDAGGDGGHRTGEAPPGAGPPVRAATSDEGERRSENEGQ